GAVRAGLCGRGCAGSWCDDLRFGGGLESDLRLLIENNTEVVSDHLTPERTLRLFTPHCRFCTEGADLWPFIAPYWAICWPGGPALYLLDNKEIAKGKTVLDLGSGCGASAIAASMSEAASVVANNTDPKFHLAIYLKALVEIYNTAIFPIDLMSMFASPMKPSSPIPFPAQYPLSSNLLPLQTSLCVIIFCNYIYTTRTII
uniref:Electron transfer flavoprotein beta subunit lysine methyltransferase n=1 Tax=Callorhinchus milii TaxID=7868 RepID=A0A4W3GB45_CALMI